jgi:hypothetical protein
LRGEKKKDFQKFFETEVKYKMAFMDYMDSRLRLADSMNAI